jgi:uncharacterized damage-inducible protein DinB
MDFEISRSIAILERTPTILTAWLQGLDEEWTHKNEGGETWSAYDIIGHLIHGENTDWPTRMEIIVSGKENKTFQPFDRFAQFNESNGKSLSALLEEFTKLRAANIRMLKDASIDENKLRFTGIHPSFGEVSLSQLLSTWVVHDLNHIGQIARVMAKQYKDAVGPWQAYLRILQS